MNNILPDKRRRAVWMRAFRIWQQTPYQVAPMSEEQHICQSCGTEYQGNYCPRCGQSACVGRFSFKTAFMLFIDVWGMGNRSMFRSIRDLMLRPGYMIRDYLRGCQSAYFPPFKMFFILTTFSLLISHGISLNLEGSEESLKVYDKIEQANGITLNGKVIDNKTIHFFQKIPKYMVLIEKKSPALFSLLMLVLASAPLYLFFRRCPAIPDLRYSEHLVALVYTSNMYSLYRMLADLIPFGLSGIIGLVAVIMIFVALKQFTGYSKLRLLKYILLTALICLACFILLLALVIAVLIFVTKF